MDANVNGHRGTIPLGVVASNVDGPPTLRIGLLGGFRVERLGVARPVSGWQRRTAKTLTKLLATYPRHALHREQILEILWPEVDVESALNSFGKALYAARRAFEPELLPRHSSAYLQLTDSMLALNTDHVVIDADHFQKLAESALGRGDVAAYESALAAYGGELLPEDRYEDWCAERRDFLEALHIRLLVDLAEALEKHGAYSASAYRFREVLQQDPTREDVHRRLMVLYAQTGARDQAVRQFQACHDVLQRELGLMPENATVALYQDILANRIPRRLPAPEVHREAVVSRQPRAVERTPGTPFVGRDSVLRHLGEQLTRADGGDGRMILVTGEAGVGKTRVVAELAAEARRRGASVLWGGSGAHANHLAYGPFAVALEGYVASRPESERNELARRYPALVHFVPSLGASDQLPPLADRPGADHLYLVPAIVRLLSDLARTRPVVLVVGDLHDLHRSSLDLLQYLAHLAVRRRWLIAGTFREERLEVGSEAWGVIEAAMWERLCLHVGLQRLARPDCDRLVQAMLPGGCVGRAALDHVYARTLGNPLCVEELVREMQECSELVLTGGCWHTAASPSERVPARVRALVAMHVAPMGKTVRRVLALAAVAGGMGISLTDLRAAAAALQPPVSDTALFEALDRALETRILEERQDAYAFRHPLVRSVLYEELSTHRREQLHAALSRSTAEIRCVPV
jgi:DNA-binding SARP family transcriptional activator